ncbi:trimeric LpxA-like protein [Aspergillus egyptiacus]|nr:trimeric LpxA-like protein [Aspergillus egyptiacus]
MDSRQPSSQNLLRPPPPHHRPSAASSSSSTPRPPLAPVSAHPTAIISESAIFHGTYKVSVGKGTVIHPRARINATEGPVKIGDGCIVCERSVIGTPPAPVPASAGGSGGYGGGGGGEMKEKEEVPVLISSNVTIGPLATVQAGVQIHSAVVVEAHAVVKRGVEIGAHSKICARCELAEGARVGEWVVVWGGGKGVVRRRRIQGKAGKAVVMHAGPTTDGVLEGRVIEDARLKVLRREREALARLIPPVAGRRKT